MQENSAMPILDLEELTLSSVRSLSRVRLFATPRITARQASLSITNSRSPLRFMSIESVMPSRDLILYRPLLLLPPIPHTIKVFSNESTLRMRWPKYYSYTIKNSIPGLPWWSSGLDFAFQSRGCKFNPWSGSSDPT